jgi:ABC-type nickel/cobalt efflux system permease component RcnA
MSKTLSLIPLQKEEKGEKEEEGKEEEEEEKRKKHRHKCTCVHTHLRRQSMHLKEKFTKQISKTEMKVLLLPEYFAYLH